MDAYLGPSGVLTGSMRLAQEAQEQAVAKIRAVEGERGRRAQGRKRKMLEDQMASLRLELEATEEDTHAAVVENQAREVALSRQTDAMACSRKADVIEIPATNGKMLQGGST